MKHAFLALVALGALTAPALAAPHEWMVTEENEAGLKAAQGTWNVKTEGDTISGTANMQFANGNPLTYKLSGTMKDGVYTIEMTDRSDGYKGCVWTGHSPRAGSAQTTGFSGLAPCDGGKKFVLRVTY